MTYCEFEIQPDGTFKRVELKRADLVSVVRCRDCRHAEPDNSGRRHYKDRLWCSKLGGDDSISVGYDDFCAWGERK